MTRRGRLLLAIAAVLTLALSACSSDDGAANTDDGASDDIFTYQGEDRQERLEAGAAEEGSVTWYTTLTGEVVQNVVDGFEAKYPDLSVEVFRADGSDLITRIIQEDAAGRLEGDVYEIGGELLLRDMGLRQPFYTPEAENVPAEWRDMDGDNLLEATVRAALISFAYNSNLLDPELIPETLEDLKNPELTSQMRVTSSGTTVDWLGLIYQTLGEEEGRAFIQELGEGGLRVEPVSGSALGVMVARGEIAAGPAVNYSDFVELSGDGLPIKWVPINPVKATPGNAGILKGTDSPHAAVLFMDYLLGPEGRALLDDAGWIAPYGDLPFPEDVEIGDVLDEMETALDYQEAYEVWLSDLEAATGTG